MECFWCRLGRPNKKFSSRRRMCLELAGECRVMPASTVCNTKETPQLICSGWQYHRDGSHCWVLTLLMTTDASFSMGLLRDWTAALRPCPASATPTPTRPSQAGWLPKQPRQWLWGPQYSCWRSCLPPSSRYPTQRSPLQCCRMVTVANHSSPQRLDFAF